jgi:archaellum component FlaC
MSETKRAWQDVATILKDAGWPESDGDEQEAPLAPLPPFRKTPARYRFLHAGAIGALSCGLLILLSMLATQQRTDGTRLAEMEGHRTELLQQVQGLLTKQERYENELRDTERLIAKTRREMESAGQSMTTLAQSVQSLQETEERLRKELAASSKTLNTLKDDLRSELSAIRERVSKERHDREAAIESINKRLNQKQAAREDSADNKRLLGKWKLLSAEREPSKELPIRDAIFEIKPGKMILSKRDKEFGSAEYSIGGTQFIKISWKEDGALRDLPLHGLGKSQDGLFEIASGDLMKIALGLSGERPKDFTTRGHPRVVLFILRKVE